MSTSQSKTVSSTINKLEELAYNLRWTWHQPTRDLFRQMAGESVDPDRINPIAILNLLKPKRIEQLNRDRTFVENVTSLVQHANTELASSDTWYQSLSASGSSPLVAYFSAEFGLTEQLPIYSGGLGVLAGDHLKSASALGVPLVGVGLFYYDGYFRQLIDREGWQKDVDLQSDTSNLPIRLVRDNEDMPLTIAVEFPGRTARAQVWRADVGRVPLYLMDTRLPENRPEDQAISDRLYGGDQDMRLRQEIVLGIGGYRLLNALGLEPQVFHLNEGHSSFLSLERIRQLMQERDTSFAESLARTTAGTVFTTHTPVAAGHDYFPAELMQKYFEALANDLDLEWQEFLSIGRVDKEDSDSPFGMTELAMRTSSARNGVSELHGEVTREMWTKLWPETTADEVPIGHVTNGVHMETWIAPELASLFDDQLGCRWKSEPTTFDTWTAIEQIPDERLWTVHGDQKTRLVTTARNRLQQQMTRYAASRGARASADGVLNPDALTIGFARRFTAYKRATLLLTDIDRLAGIVASSDRPVQFIFSGKAHPQDLPGKQLIQRLASIAQREPFKGRVLFLEDYDMAIARRMVTGVDVWLNNPTRPQEASGTSGMKAAANGVLNFSILDGWWAEAWETAQKRDELIGWSIDPGHSYEDQDQQNAADAIRLYEVLEQEIVPAFYERNEQEIPELWVKMMKASIRSTIPEFSGVRMVADYTRNYYLPASSRSSESS